MGFLLLGVLCGLVLAETLVVLRNLLRLRTLEQTAGGSVDRWPRVSVVMTARNEADTVACAVASRLADDYPGLEVILVDDRSTDGTGSAARRAAGGDHRFTLIRVDDLPDGWLGKVHALEAGYRRATGEWVLFSDGDVVVEPGTMRRAIAHCERVGLDLLALLPSFRSGSFLMDGAWAVFLRGLVVMADPVRVRDPDSRVVLGSGGFNLVRRSAFAATGGFADLRMETADDLALAGMVKSAGGRIEFMQASKHATVTGYRSIGELLRGIEKNGSTTAAIPFPLFALALVALGLVLFSPFAALTAGPIWLRVLGAATLVAYTASQAYVLWRNTGRTAPAVIWPPAYLILAYGMIRATWLAHRNGGVYWRGSFYPMADLEAGRRFTL